MAAKTFKMTLKHGWDPEPWIVLPSQMGPRAALTPCQRLCWAVLETVIHDLAHPEPRYSKNWHTALRPSLRSEAIAYIQRTDHYWAFSFDRVCEHLDIDPAAFRHAVEKARAA